MLGAYFTGALLRPSGRWEGGRRAGVLGHTREQKQPVVKLGGPGWGCRRGWEWGTHSSGGSGVVLAPTSPCVILVQALGYCSASPPPRYEQESLPPTPHGDGAGMERSRSWTGLGHRAGPPNPTGLWRGASTEFSPTVPASPLPQLSPGSERARPRL